jgi:hypothetical protein
MAEKKITTQKRKSKNVDPHLAMKYHLIDKYREVVAKRYDYALIKNHPEMPANITPEIVDSLKRYFLDNLYPVPETRAKLDAAFMELEGYVSQPAKVWDLLGNLTAAIFRFGLQLPTALRAGLHSLKAYSSAKLFENALLQAALEKKYSIPLSDEQFYECLKAIPIKELEHFINEVGELFRSFTDTALLEKTIDMMTDVLKHMKSKPEMYSTNETDAIDLGLEILQKGHDLFMHYDDAMKDSILEFITGNEKKFIAGLHKRG